MAPIRLADALDDRVIIDLALLQTGAQTPADFVEELLNMFERGDIVTPADEALAKIANPIIIQEPTAAEHSCVGCDTARRWALGERGHHDSNCEWVKSKAKVAALGNRE